MKLEEVAERAGVSTATVSRAFNSPEKVSDDVRARVLAAAEALSWIPNAAGRALASSRTHIAGAIIPTLDDEIFARQIGGMQAVYARHDFTLLLGCSNYDPQEGLRQVQAMLARGVESLTIVGEEHPPELFEAIRVARIPYMITYSYRGNCPHPCIGFDNRAAFEEIIAHLLSLGHRRFGAIFQPKDNNDRVKARLEGIRAALEAHGLALDDALVRIGPSSMEFGAASFGSLMSDNAVAPTAIVCGNDNIAWGALTRAQDMGLRAGADFSITGFDDLMISSRLSPRLTTMWVDNEQIGKRAAGQLLAVLENRQATPQSFQLTAELRIRETSQRPLFD